MMRIIPETKLQITIAVATAVIGATATVSWVCANGLRDIKEEISGLRQEVISVRNEAWTYTDQYRWVGALSKQNRFTSIEVPTVPDRPKRPN